MELTRDERRLAEIRSKIAVLSVASKDDFNLATRYHSLVTLEEILRQRVNDAPAGARRSSAR